MISARLGQEGRKRMSDGTNSDFEIEILSDESLPGAGAQADLTPAGKWLFWFEPTEDGGHVAWVNGREGRPFDVADGSSELGRREEGPRASDRPPQGDAPDRHYRRGTPASPASSSRTMTGSASPLAKARRARGRAVR